MAPNLEENIKSVHDETKPLKCEICYAYFADKANLKKHAKLVHEAKKIFKCPNCVSTYTQTGSLNRHIKSVHVGKKQSEAVPKYSDGTLDTSEKVIQGLLSKQVLLSKLEIAGHVPQVVSPPLNTRYPSKRKQKKNSNKYEELISESVDPVAKKLKYEATNEPSMTQEAFLGLFNLAKKDSETVIVKKKTRRSGRLSNPHPQFDRQVYIQKSLSENTKKLQCPSCDKKYIKDYLSIHIRKTHHEEKDPTSDSSINEKEFNEKESLKESEKESVKNSKEQGESNCDDQPEYGTYDFVQYEFLEGVPFLETYESVTKEQLLQIIKNEFEIELTCNILKSIEDSVIDSVVKKLSNGLATVD